MKKIKSALISLSDKSNLKSLLHELKKNNIKIISSGGTFNAIKKLKFKCFDVSDFTGFKEILNGRVKTLHPKIHAGILNKRNSKSHSKEIKRNNFENFVCSCVWFVHLFARRSFILYRSFLVCLSVQRLKAYYGP